MALAQACNHLPSPPLTPHFISSVCLSSHILSNEAKSSMLNETSQLCHWRWSGCSWRLLAHRRTNTALRQWVRSFGSVRSTAGVNNVGRALTFGRRELSAHPETRCHMCGLERTDKVTESKFVCESATGTAAEIGTVPKIKSRETRAAGYQPVDCAALSFKVLSFRISYRI